MAKLIYAWVTTVIHRKQDTAIYLFKKICYKWDTSEQPGTNMEDSCMIGSGTNENSALRAPKLWKSFLIISIAHNFKTWKNWKALYRLLVIRQYW